MIFQSDARSARPRTRRRFPWPAVALAVACLAAGAGAACAQNVRLFGDSPTGTYLDPSWGYANSPSHLTLVNGSHFPVTTAHVFLGTNALWLAWTSVSGGDWMLTAATPGWAPLDLTPSDTLLFVVWSSAAIPAAELPDVLLEDANNVRTPRHPLSAYVAGVPAGAWTRVAIPLSVFRAAPGAADLTRVNKVFFAQGAATSGVARAMAVDEIRFVAGGVGTPAAPAVTVRTFERHLEVRWDPAAIPTGESVRIEREVQGAWVTAGTARAADGGYVDWLGATGVSGSYRGTTVDWHLGQSAPGNVSGGVTAALSQDQWLDMVEEAAFRYFWLHGHPVSGLARERYGSGDVCATGGTGMGLMATVAGSARGYLPRAAAAARVRQILEFYAAHARTYHGAFSHWVDGVTGLTHPFDNPSDSTGDIVETSYFVQGMLAARQYFDGPDTTEARLRQLATQLWQGVDWNAYRPVPPGNAVYWLWSPTTGFSTSFPVSGWNECMIVYLLATASPTHPVSARCYWEGYSRYGAMVNGNTYLGYRIWLGDPYAPLFFAHYSFLGFDPRFKRDRYANYFAQNRNHTYVDRAYCTLNPAGRTGYGSSIWGLTASDDPAGYAVHQPYSNDNGTLSPTAALSSMPYTPTESIQALQAMYRTYGQRLWGVFGFYDAFNPGQNWYSNSYIAIDQGPIAVMIENFRSQLVWNRFMSNPEIAPALDSLGFAPDSSVVDVPGRAGDAGPPRLAALPNPSRSRVSLDYTLPGRMQVDVAVFDLQGRRVARLGSGVQEAGRHTLAWDGRDGRGRLLPDGVYLGRLEAGGATVTVKLIRLH